MADTQIYGHADIQRYLQHKMLPQEMHEFEKALMKDPFLADALEGFSASDNGLAEKHIAAIERLLNNEKQEAKVVPLAVQKTAWWKVAAIILVIILAGSITYSVINHRDAGLNDRIAITVPKTVGTEKDSIRPADKPLAQIQVLPQNLSLPASKNTSPIIRHDANEPVAFQKQKPLPEEANDLRDSAKENTSLIASSVVTPKNLNDEMFSSGRAMLVNQMPQNEFKGKVEDKSGEPLPFVNIKANNNSFSATTDAKGNFTLKAADSVLQVSVSSPGYVSAVATIRSNKADNKITLKEEEMSLAEIIVANLSKKKKNVAAEVRIDSSIAAEPVGGWKNFRHYISQQLDSLKATGINDDFNDDIELEFLIDKKGQPTDIKASAETDKMIADKAIKILANGPRWKNTKKEKKVKVIIGF